LPQIPLHLAGALLVHCKWDVNRVVEEFVHDTPALLAYVCRWHGVAS
jgi:hypothetical protein